MEFWAIFTHNSGENDNIDKNINLVLKIISKKVFLKYQVNGSFPSLC